MATNGYGRGQTYHQAIAERRTNSQTISKIVDRIS